MRGASLATMGLLAVPVWLISDRYVRALKGTVERAERSAFVGRRAELRQFTGAVEACRETGHGEVVVVRGEAGMGKTRLVEEFTAIAVDRGFAPHKGLVLDFGVGKGQDAVRAIVRSLLSIAPGSGKEIRVQAAEGITIGLSYDAQIAEDFLANNFRIQVRFEF